MLEHSVKWVSFSAALVPNPKESSIGQLNLHTLRPIGASECLYILGIYTHFFHYIPEVFSGLAIASVKHTLRQRS
ncbi:hypothetical protein Mterra_01584 [Calidithermus terrae]|uniref:Uncharacterized protein n=1 Tax=Calidithermus terrae TaxID=1408545 RepID=A0A399EUM3_9DEIN|nr:hypothetical protein Mterra_01584 [Calidithermus terrae]